MPEAALFPYLMLVTVISIYSLVVVVGGLVLSVWAGRRRYPTQRRRR